MKALAIVMLLSLCLTSVGVAAPPQAIEPAVVFSALQLIRTNHIDRPDPIRLLGAALDGLRQALSWAGATERLADLDTGSETSARTSFVARFNQSIPLVRGKMTAAVLEYAAVNAMTNSFGDPLNFFMTPEQAAEFGRGGFSGIGIRLRRVDSSMYVWHVFQGSPAARAGVREFDRIVAVDGQSIQGRTQADVINRIRGAEGSTVRLTIRRPGRPAPLALSITRGSISPVSMVHRMLEGGVGLIRLFNIGQGASQEVSRALQDLTNQGMRALILDLRFSSGGPYRELDEISRLLLPPGLPIYSVTGQETLTYRTTGTPLLSPGMRLIALISDDTEALAELLAAAISEHGRGRLVGTKTAGLGGLYRTFDLPGGGALRIKTSRASTGKGVPLENGVRPDVEVRLSASDLDRGQDPQLERAMQMASQP